MREIDLGVEVEEIGSEPVGAAKTSYPELWLHNTNIPEIGEEETWVKVKVKKVRQSEDYEDNSKSCTLAVMAIKLEDSDSDSENYGDHSTGIDRMVKSLEEAIEKASG